MKIRNPILGAWILSLTLLANPARAEDPPIGIAQSKNLVQRSLTIDDQTFEVTGQTALFDLAGRPMRLEQVETTADQGDFVELDRVSYAYEAAGSVLLTLRAAPLPR